MSKLIDRLGEAKIYSERDFADRGGAEIYITFQRDHPHALGYKQYQAHAWARTDNGWGRKTFKPSSLGMPIPELRKDCLAQAQAWAERRQGAAEWVAGPFPDSWQTKETRARVLALLDEMSAS